MLRFIILADNTAKDGLISEWGLSIYIEYGKHKYLLDAGQTDVFIRNADKLHIDLTKVDKAVLSHGHYDHGSGFDAFFKINHVAPLYVSKNLRENCYHLKGFFPKYIGVRHGFLATHSSRLVKVGGVFKLDEGVYIVPHSSVGLKSRGRKAKMYKRFGIFWTAESFDHEQSLVFETKEGFVVFSSCSHAGVENILSEVREALGGKKIPAFVGGLHLHESSKEDVLATADALRNAGVNYLYTGHCTGEESLEILKNSEKIQTIPTFVGMKVEIE